ncbi:restriction endonuclease subunit S [Cryobacterium sp. Hh11]|uniref:restriction endonuclease subunit S n=1 Tax=Cryobacterium sp. Hh11 TaxID=2555868 RepID=UPI00106C2FD9|nr:restriction endonuclease subunit S [Cryobacterium sp. Hh11]TFD48557.1 restriction endonuclease subunit S [Cryobacterium sp. Hh11]
MTWPTARLDEIAEIVGGSTPRTGVAAYWNGDIPWVTPADLSSLSGHYIGETPRMVTAEGLSNSGSKLLAAGSVLFSSRAPIGHVAINSVPMATNQGFKSLVPDQTRADAKYLYWWLRANKTYLQSLGNGATFKEVSKAIVSRVEVPLPPLAEQRRIAAILDQADELRTKRRRALTLLDELADSLFVDMFGDPVQNERGWPLAVMDEILDGIDSGTSPVCQDRRATDGEWGVLKLGAISTGEYLPRGNNKALLPNATPNRQHEVKVGDVLFSRKNTMDLVGASVFVGETPTQMLLPDLMFRLVLHQAVAIEAVFLQRMLAQLSMRDRIRRLASGSAASMSNISKSKLLGLKVPVPPQTLQQEFVERAAVLESARQTVLSEKSLLDELFASLQHRAFRGEL